MAAVAIQTATAAKGLDRFAEFTPAPGLNPARLSLALHPKGEGGGSRVVSVIPALRGNDAREPARTRHLTPHGALEMVPSFAKIPRLRRGMACCPAPEMAKRSKRSDEFKPHPPR